MILVTTSREESSVPYVAALRSVGFAEDEIRVVSPDQHLSAEEIADLGRRASGLLLSGGCDVEPSRYGEEEIPGAAVETLPERDALEWALLGVARERRLPVWGICRGLQVANVFFGGSLWQDLPSQVPGALEHTVPVPVDSLAHGVRVIAPDSVLGRRLAAAPIEVNSRHHQAVKTLGAGLKAVATSPDGLTEAFELDAGANGDADGGAWWVRGVQWHPENLVALPEQRALWEDFAAAVRRRAEEPDR